MIKYFIYARKSNKGERQTESIEDQINRIKKLIPEAKDAIEIITEKESARDPCNRPHFTQTMNDIKKQKGKYGLIARHPDRLARNAIEGGEIMYLLEKGILADLKFTDFIFHRNADGMKALLSAFVDSKHYSDKLSENVPLIMKERFLKEKKLQSIPLWNS